MIMLRLTPRLQWSNLSSMKDDMLRVPSLYRRSLPLFLVVVLLLVISPLTVSALVAPTTLPVQVVERMPPPLLSSNNHLHNKYYLLRHGQSTANVAHIISSARTLAYTIEASITATGYQQGQEAARQLLQMLERSSKPGERVVFVSSPFARAYQTALACVEELQHQQELQDRIQQLELQLQETVEVEDNLVERYFGRLDGQAIDTYAYVWPLDKFDVFHTAFHVESVAAVATRIHSLILAMEQKHNHNDDNTDGGLTHVVLVSHADVLQIAQLYASGMENVGLFSSYRFKNGEVREMVIGSTDHLPPPKPLQAPQRGTANHLAAVMAETVRHLEKT